jgi:hypothetical protein
MRVFSTDELILPTKMIDCRPVRLDNPIVMNWNKIPDMNCSELVLSNKTHVNAIHL